MKKLNLTLSLLLIGAVNFTFAQQNSIPTNGNVGIGTTNPNAKLDVNGRVKIDSTLVVKDSVTIEKSMRVMEESSFEGDSKFTNVDITGTLKVGGASEFNGTLSLPGTGTTTNTDGRTFLITRENGLVERLTIDAFNSLVLGNLYEPRTCPTGTIQNPTWANGPNKIYSECPQVRVGIGTNAPTHGLHVTTNARLAQAKVDVSMAVGDEPNTFARLYIKNNLLPAGIHVSNIGNTQQYGKLLFMEYDNATTEIFNIQNTTTSTTTYSMLSDGSMTLNNGTNDFFKLDANGKLTIHNGTQKILQLESNGTLRGRHMKIDVDNWADFVFEDDYQLMPLNEVEQFVKTEKHLPNVPSEKELKANGMDVQEMNAVLMQKVEELTLYLIEQDKEIETMKARIEELETEK